MNVHTHLFVGCLFFIIAFAFTVIDETKLEIFRAIKPAKKEIHYVRLNECFKTHSLNITIMRVKYRGVTTGTRQGL